MTTSTNIVRNENHCPGLGGGGGDQKNMGHVLKFSSSGLSISSSSITIA